MMQSKQRQHIARAASIHNAFLSFTPSILAHHASNPTYDGSSNGIRMTQNVAISPTRLLASLCEEARKYLSKSHVVPREAKVITATTRTIQCDICNPRLLIMSLRHLTTACPCSYLAPNKKKRHFVQNGSKYCFQDYNHPTGTLLLPRALRNLHSPRSKN